MRSKQAKDHFIDLALQGGEMGREDCQEGWHKFLERFQHGTVLDVGAGLGWSKGRISNCTTQDPQPGELIDITSPIENILDNTFDTVTAFDVIEHVVEDVTFLEHLCRVARRAVFLTTPNLDVSKAANGCHCREYSPREFATLISYISLKFHMEVYFYHGKGDGSWLLPSHLRDFIGVQSPHLAAFITLEKS